MGMEVILELQTTLDDCSPQVIGYVLERAFELGALDAYAAAVQMKKNRPGVLLTVLARPEAQETLVNLLLTETPSLGVRVQRCERVVLERRVVSVDTAYGALRLKVAGGKAMAEYEDCRAAARQHRVPLRQVQEAALAAWRQQVQK